MAVKNEKGVLRLIGIESGQILSLLEGKHSQDVMIPECKNGETWGARDLLKLDAWVLRRSYSPLTTIGYEIKISRQDFEQDQKWMGYLDLCHEFYFVCPAGLIRATDLPQQVGIIWASPTKLHTKRKAQRQKPDVEKLNRLLIYAMMSRAKIVGDMYAANSKVEPEDPLLLRRQSVERAEAREELADFIKGHVRKYYLDTVEKDRNMRYREEAVKRFEKALALLGITWDSSNVSWQDNMRVEREIADLKKAIDSQTLHHMKRLGQTLQGTAEALEKYIEK